MQTRTTDDVFDFDIDPLGLGVKCHAIRQA